MDSCSHDAANVVIDTAGGSRICTACGVVLESCMFAEQPTVHSAIPLDPNIEILMCRATEILAEYAATMSVGEKNIHLTALEILRDIAGMHPNLLRRPKVHQTAASCLYFGFRVHGVDRSENEMLACCPEISSKALAISNKFMRRSLSTRPYGEALTRAISTDALIPRYLEHLVQSPYLIDPAKKRRIRALADRACEQFTNCTKSPQARCVAAILRALGPSITVKLRDEICHRCRIGVPTVTKILREF